MPSRRRSFAKRFIHSIDVDDSPRARKSRARKSRCSLVSSPAPTNVHCENINYVTNRTAPLGGWTEVRPSTSANAHMFIKAISLSYGQDKAKAFALTLRQAFFMQALDISQIPVLLEIAKQHGLEVNRLRTSIDNGTALAMLLSDYRKASQQNIAGSPSFVMNNNRQVLYGNVGYRVLHANVEELLKNPEHEASWC